jgi:hypothetical protein
VLHQIAEVGRDDEVSGRIDRELGRALECECDRPIIRAGRDDEIVLELLSVAVVHDVHARVDIAIFDLRIAANARPPFPRVIAEHVVRHPWQGAVTAATGGL